MWYCGGAWKEYVEDMQRKTNEEQVLGELQLKKNVHIHGRVLQRKALVGHVPRQTEEFHNIIIIQEYDRKWELDGLIRSKLKIMQEEKLLRT